MKLRVKSVFGLELSAIMAAATLGVASLVSSPDASAGRLFVSGHDSDFHAQVGNTLGAQNIINRSLDFVRNSNSEPILLLKSNTDNLALGDHLDSELGLVASGYTSGTVADTGNFYVLVNETDFATTDLSSFSAIFVPSDHGGTLTGLDLEALFDRAADILDYLFDGGGLVAFAEDGFRTGGGAGLEFDFLPMDVDPISLDASESGLSLTAFGLSLGLTDADVNGNFSHNFFDSTGGLNIVDVDPSGRIISLAGDVLPQQVVPEPGSAALVLLGLTGLGVRRRRMASQPPPRAVVVDRG